MKDQLPKPSPRLLLAEQLWRLLDAYNIFGKPHSWLNQWLFLELLKATQRPPYSLTIKSLNAERNAADSAVRKALHTLKDDGWIQIASNPDDQRVQCILPTEKFHAIAQAYLSKLDACFNDANV